MTLFGRLLLLLRYHLSGGLKEVEDPRRALDLAYTRQVELLVRLRGAVAQVITARRRLELQARQLRPAADRLDEQARTAVVEGRQDRARAALVQRNMLRGEVEELRRQTAALAVEEARLVEVTGQLDLQVQQLRIRRESLNAAYAAVRAREQVGEALAEQRLESAQMDAVIHRAEAAVAETRVRAQAIERLALARAAEGGGTQTALPAPSSEVEVELARMEEELLWGQRLTPDPPPG